MARLTSNDMLPFAAGGAVLVLLALAGVGMAMSRRKRRLERQEFKARQQYLDAAEAEPVLDLNSPVGAAPEPAIARATAPIHDPVPEGKTPVGKLPSDVDPSELGRHVRAAYRGPTHDNPSASLEYRLRQAAALDQEEAEAAERAGSKGAAQTAKGAIPAKGNWESRPDADFIFNRAGSKPAKREEVQD